MASDRGPCTYPSYDDDVFYEKQQGTYTPLTDDFNATFSVQFACDFHPAPGSYQLQSTFAYLDHTFLGVQ